MMRLVATSISWRGLWRKQAALPAEHGAWVFLLSPLVIGLAIGWRDRAGPAEPAAVALLVLGALAAFLLRQPVGLAVKALSGRRPRADLPAAAAWAAVYGGLGLAACAGLAALGHGRLLLLALPAAPVFAWHLWLVSRRAERRQALVEMLGSGVLAMAAPAGYWLLAAGPAQALWPPLDGGGAHVPGGVLALGLWLWLACWAQSAASIVYAYLRLAQRPLRSAPPWPERLRMAAPSLAFTTFNLAASAALSLAVAGLPLLLPLAFAVQWLEALYGGLLRPALGARPAAIGVRQLVVSVVFTGIVAIGR
jgi:hypothetical protein